MGSIDCLPFANSTWMLDSCAESISLAFASMGVHIDSYTVVPGACDSPGRRRRRLLSRFSGRRLSEAEHSLGVSFSSTLAADTSSMLEVATNMASLDMEPPLQDASYSSFALN